MRKDPTKAYPKPSFGYHFHSSRRYPAAPEVCACDHISHAPYREPSYVGQHRVDGTLCYAWRTKDENGKPFYAFQTAFGA